jgi:hypothetical protein
MSPLLKKLITMLLLVVTAGVIYTLSIGEGDEELGGDTSLAGTEVELRTQKILSDTQKINGYLQDASIFEDKRFTSLQDFRVQLIDTPTGRANPFNPVQ